MSDITTSPPRVRKPGAIHHVMIVGAGNIGSFLAPLVARIATVAVITVVDPDRFEPHNLTGQSIRRADIGRAKALVQKRRIAEIDPRIEVRAVVRRFEDFPIGADLPDVILTALDGRAPRMAVNQAAWHLGGIPVIDTGVNPDGSLVRLSTQLPSPDAACLECTWSDQDYAELEQRYACDGEVLAAAPTGAPAALGGLAASLQALECERLLEGAPLAPREVMISAEWDRHFVTPLRRNPDCRFDHQRFDLEVFDRSPGDLQFGEVLEIAGGSSEARFRVEGNLFVHTVRCASCGVFRKTLRLRNRLRPRELRCGACGGSMSFGGFDCTEWLDRHTLHPLRRRSLRSAGLAPGDVLTIAAAGSELHRHFVLAGATTRAADTEGDRP